MANTTSTRTRRTRRGPTPAQIKRAACRRFFMHLRVAVVVFMLLVLAVAAFGVFSKAFGLALLVFVGNAALGAVNLVQWRGWVK